MGAPAIVMNDRIVGTCPGHMVPSASGTAPAGPLPFSAPLVQGLVANVLINGKQAAVMGSSGFNTIVHPGIVDPPFAAPNMQVGRVLTGSQRVMIGTRPAATVQSTANCCATPGQLMPTVSNVLIGQ